MNSMPEEFGVYKDIEDRKLWIRKIDIGNPFGRDVQGNLIMQDMIKIDYSCTLRMWEEIWRDRVPRCNPEKMKIG